MTTTQDRNNWINRATELLTPDMPNNAREYAESLYQTYVLDYGQEWTPEAAVREDKTYWGD